MLESNVVNEVVSDGAGRADASPVRNSVFFVAPWLCMKRLPLSLCLVSANATSSLKYTDGYGPLSPMCRMRIESSSDLSCHPPRFHLSIIANRSHLLFQSEGC